MKIDLLKIDMDAGKHWIQRVTADISKNRLAWIRAKNRAKWLHAQGREREAQKLDAVVAALNEKFGFDTYTLGG